MERLLTKRLAQKKADEVDEIIRMRLENLNSPLQEENLEEVAGHLPSYPGYHDSTNRQRVAYAAEVWKVALGKPHPKTDPKFWACQELITRTVVKGVAGVKLIRALAEEAQVTAENLLQAEGCKNGRGYRGLGWSGSSTYNSLKEAEEKSERLLEARRGFLDQFSVMGFWSPSKREPFLSDVCHEVGTPFVVDTDNPYFLNKNGVDPRYQIVEYRPKRGAPIYGVVLGKEASFFQCVPLVCRGRLIVGEDKKQLRVSGAMGAEVVRLFSWGCFESRGTVFTPYPEGQAGKVLVYSLTEENFLTNRQLESLRKGNQPIPGVRFFDVAGRPGL